MPPLAAVRASNAQLLPPAFTHICPGLVSTPLFRPWARPLADLLLTSIDDCGKYMMYALLDCGGNGGAKRKGARGDDLGMEGYYGGEEVREREWVHTMEVIDNALTVSIAESGDIVAWATLSNCRSAEY